MLPPLHSVQKRALAKIVKNFGGIVWHKVGEGKTRIALCAFATLQNEHPSVLAGRPLIVVTRRKAFDSWREEIEQCFPLWTVEELDKPTYEKPDVILVSEGMLGRKKSGDVVVEIISRRPAFVAIDEGYLFKNPRSTRSKMIQRVTTKIRSMIMSGSIMTAGKLEDIYAQAMAINQHRRISPTLTAYRERYMQSFNTMGFPAWWPKKGSYDKIMALCEPFTDVHFPTEGRKITQQTVAVDPTPDQKRLFKELKETYALEAAGVELNNALSVMLRIQQISNGYFLDGEGVLHRVSSNKVSALNGILEELMDAGERAIVWCAFKNDIDVLMEQIPFATLQMSSKHSFDSAAWKSGKANVVLATEQSGASINDFAQVAYAIYFSQDYKWLSLQQSMGRTNRRSSLHPECFYYFLHTRGSMDARIHSTVSQNRNLESALLRKGELIQWAKESI